MLPQCECEVVERGDPRAAVAETRRQLKAGLQMPACGSRLARAGAKDAHHVVGLRHRVGLPDRRCQFECLDGKPHRRGVVASVVGTQGEIRVESSTLDDVVVLHGGQRGLQVLFCELPISSPAMELAQFVLKRGERRGCGMGGGRLVAGRRVRITPEQGLQITDIGGESGEVGMPQVEGPAQMRQGVGVGVERPCVVTRAHQVLGRLERVAGALVVMGDDTRSGADVGPALGFGKMWQKTYKVSLDGAGVSPQEVIVAWKHNFASFWPKDNLFYGPLAGIVPGDVAVLDLKMPGHTKLSTGVLVLYADDESFTFMTPEGHMLAGWITFSAFGRGGATWAQAQVLMRAQDPLSEMGLTLGGHRQENVFWSSTLRSLAAHFGVHDAAVETEVVCVDGKRQWSKAGNVRSSAAIQMGMYAMSAPMRLLAKPFRRPSEPR